MLAVADARLAVGVTVDRPRARELARALRTIRAFDQAVGIVERQERSRAQVKRRLAQRGIRGDDVRQAVTRLASIGGVDDERFARGRAALLAGRSYGDAAIADDLARAGIDPERVRAALATLRPEAERAEIAVTARGCSVRTIRYLAARGFAEDSIERFVPETDHCEPEADP